ncbi:PhoPQ-activated protein PqaA family protein [Vibrio sp. PP-XX7]
MNVDKTGQPVPIVPEEGNNESAIAQQLSAIALRYGSIVANLRDLPNEYLTFDDGVARTEDGIVAYTWKQYMDDPAKKCVLAHLFTDGESGERSDGCHSGRSVNT